MVVFPIDARQYRLIESRTMPDTKLNDKLVTLIACDTADGAEYALYYAIGGPTGFLVVRDPDRGELVGVEEFATRQAARMDYKAALAGIVGPDASVAVG